MKNMKKLKRILAGTLALVSIFPAVGAEKFDDKELNVKVVNKKYDPSLIKKVAGVSIAGGMVAGVALDWVIRELWGRTEYNNKMLYASKYVSLYYSVKEIRDGIENYYPKTRIGEDFKYLFKILNNVDTSNDPHSQEPINAILERVYDFIFEKSPLVSERDLYLYVRDMERKYVSGSSVCYYEGCEKFILDMSSFVVKEFDCKQHSADKLRVHLNFDYDNPHALKNFKSIKGSKSTYSLAGIVVDDSKDSTKSVLYLKENGKWYRRSIYDRSLTGEVSEETIDDLCSHVRAGTYLIYQEGMYQL